MAEKKRISLAIYGVPSSDYRRLLLKDKAGIALPLITDNLRQDYYSVRFQTDGYIISRHFVGTLYNGLREGYRVFSIGIPYGYSFMNWENAFNQMELAFKDALNGAEDNLQIESNLSRSQTFDTFIVDWQLAEAEEQFRINVGTEDTSKQGIVGYTDSRDLEHYFCDPCRQAFDGYGIIYFAEKGSLAENKLAMQAIPISEPAVHERKYSVTIKYYDAETSVKLGEKPAFPENVSSVKDMVTVKISEAYYEEVELTGALDDNEKWRIQKNDDGMGYTLVIALKPKAYQVKLVCDELDEKGVTDYSEYVETNVGIIRNKEIILIGREKEEKICLSLKNSSNLQVEILSEDDDCIRFKFKKSFVLSLVNNKGCLSVLQKTYKMRISKVELHSSKEREKLREIKLPCSEEISGIPDDYYLVFVSVNYENFRLSMTDYMDGKLPDKPIKKKPKVCRIVFKGKKLDSVLQKGNPLTIECKRENHDCDTITCYETEYSLKIPEGETWNCVFKLKGYKPQSEIINSQDNEQMVTLHLTASRRSLFFIDDVIKKWSIPFIGGLLVGFFLESTIQTHSRKVDNFVDADSVQCADSAKYVDSYLRSQASIPPEEASIVDVPSDPVQENTESVEMEADTCSLDAAKHIEVLGGIEFTADDIKAAERYYQNNNKKIDTQTATLLRNKIRCAKVIIKACQKGFAYKDVSDMLKMKVVNTVYTEEQKAALQKLIDSGSNCSQESGKSIEEKLGSLYRI